MQMIIVLVKLKKLAHLCESEMDYSLYLSSYKKKYLPFSLTFTSYQPHQFQILIDVILATLGSNCGAVEDDLAIDNFPDMFAFLCVEVSVGRQAV